MRHIEVQIFGGDGQGDIQVLRRAGLFASAAQPEEWWKKTPAPNLREEVHRPCTPARRLVQSVSYRSAGTVGCGRCPHAGLLFSGSQYGLQGGHGVTDGYGVDIVKWIIKLPTGDLPALNPASPSRRALRYQARLCAEDFKIFSLHWRADRGSVFHSNLRVWTPGSRH
jgi:acetyl/propionyl-CoA carboxylase alpha subunit